jgi:transcriptional regulator with XRE-family HTH domain
METVAHWTQKSTADFVYSISSNFVAQIEPKIEEEGISQNEIAEKMKKTSGRVSQLLNNPGNLSIRVMVEVARALGMKVGVVAYDDNDPDNTRGPIDPDVFRKCWENAGRPVNLFGVEETPACDISEAYLNNVTGSVLSIGAEWQIPGYGVNNSCYIGGLADLYPTAKIVEPVRLLGNFQISAPQVSNPNELWLPPFPSELGGFHKVWHQQPQTIPELQENAA